MNSPLGKYGQLVAAVTAVGVIGAYVFATLFGELLSLGNGAAPSLKEFALIAIGAVFGAAATVNGVKSPIDAAHSRIDKIETATGIQTHGSYPAGNPNSTDPVPPAPITTDHLGRTL